MQRNKSYLIIFYYFAPNILQVNPFLFNIYSTGDFQLLNNKF